MSLTVSDKGGGVTFPELAPDTYVARCVRLIDLGTQESEYQGKKTSKEQVLIMWELPTEIIEEGDYAGNPRTISKFYTASTNEKATLRKDLEVWRGKAFTDDEAKGFSLINILGAPCMLSINHNEKGKAVVKGVSKLLKGMSCPAQLLPSVAFDLTAWLDGDPAQAKTYGELTDGVKGLIEKSVEFRERMRGDAPHPADSTEIPF